MADKIRKPEQKKRTESVTIRLTTEEYDRIAVLAQQFGIPLAALARDFLLQAVSLYEAGSENGECPHDTI